MKPLNQNKMDEFIDIDNLKPKLGELVLVNLKNGRKMECFRLGSKDESSYIWADSIVGVVINIEVISWKYVKNNKNNETR